MKSLRFRNSTEKVEESKPVVKQFRCKVIRADYHTVMANLYLDLAYQSQEVYMAYPITLFRRFRVSWDPNEFNIRAHLLREGDEITMFIQNPYDMYGGWITGVRNHTLGDVEIPERSE